MTDPTMPPLPPVAAPVAARTDYVVQYQHEQIGWRNIAIYVERDEAVQRLGRFDPRDLPLTRLVRRETCDYLEPHPDVTADSAHTDGAS